MKKRMTIATLALTGILGLSFAVSAQSMEEKDPYSLAPANITANDVIDTSKASVKEFSPSPTNEMKGITASAVAPYYAARSSFSGGDAISVSEAYTDPSKSRRLNIDHIGVRTVAYLNKGFVGEKSTHNYNENQAAAGVLNIPNALFSDGETYGYHVFEQRGYTTWYPESYGD